MVSCPHFKKEETKAQKDELICPGSNLSSVANVALEVSCDYRD